MLECDPTPRISGEVQDPTSHEQTHRHWDRLSQRVTLKYLVGDRMDHCPHVQKIRHMLSKPDGPQFIANSASLCWVNPC